MTRPRREITAKDILADFFEEHAFDGDWMADLLIQRLEDAGFQIVPIATPADGRRA